MNSETFVPIPVVAFQRAYATALHVLSGNLDVAPGVLRIPASLEGAPGGALVSRAWYIGGLLFADPAERASFHWRVTSVLPLVEGRKYRKYRGEDPFLLHVALLRALCVVRGNARMTRKVLRASFDDEFRRQLGQVTDGAGLPMLSS